MNTGPRKRRTRQHVIADLAVHHVEGFILRAGHAVQRVIPDYGYDLIMTLFDSNGMIERGAVSIQCKATERLMGSGRFWAHEIDVRDHNLWTAEQRPVVLVVYEAVGDRAFWVCIQDYFRDPQRRPKSKTRTVRVRIPKSDRLSEDAIEAMRKMNRESFLPALFRSEP